MGTHHGDSCVIKTHPERLSAVSSSASAMLKAVLRTAQGSGHAGVLASRSRSRLFAVPASTPAVRLLVRPFSGGRIEDEEGRRLYIGNLPWTMSAHDVAENFESFGEITNAHLPRDPEGRSRGFAFVTFASAEDASAACDEWDGREFGGRQIKVRVATPRAALKPVFD